MEMEEIISSAENDLEALFSRFSRQLENVFNDETERELFLLAFIESVNNAAEHGNKNDSNRLIKISCFLKKGFALVSVEDEGAGFDPIFPDLKKERGKRGRGLGIIKVNTEAVFFNRKGNKITFLKGGRTMKTFKNIEASVSIMANDNIILVKIESTRDEKKNKFALSKGIMEIFECLAGMKGGKKKILFDLKNVRILTSVAWGAFFAEVERKDIDLICLFNANDTIMTLAKQLGIRERNGFSSKFKVFPDNSEAVKMLECA